MGSILQVLLIFQKWLGKVERLGWKKCEITPVPKQWSQVTDAENFAGGVYLFHHAEDLEQL